ncbi:MAG TPA: LamG domain-containing protein [Kofleriaceae bacterium]|jgi:hypothetical protein|nr:LamG domain-containing protein [Kofleriaceae bacterium]
MRCAYLLWLIAGCGFSSPAGLTDDPGSPGGSNGPGGPGGPGAPAGPGGGSGSTSPCDASDPAPLLCVSFGGSSLVSDLATPAHELLEHTGIVPLANIALPVTGYVVRTAGMFGPGSQLRIKDRPDLDVNDMTLDLTIDLWMSPDGGLSSGPSSLIDNNGAYDAAYNTSGSVHCGFAGASVDSHAMVAAGTWHHVACTYGMADHQLRVYVDGDLSGCKTTSAMPRAARDGVAIGASYDPTPKPLQSSFQQHFAGRLGHLHVYGIELTPDQICGAANRTGCSQSCPGNDGGSNGEGGVVGADPGSPR